MRSDVKVGLVLGLAMLTVLGWYFLRPENPNALPLAKSDKEPAKVADAGPSDRALPPPLWTPPAPSKSGPGSPIPPAAKGSPSRPPAPKTGVAVTPAPSPTGLDLERPRVTPPSPAGPAETAPPKVAPSLQTPPMAAAVSVSQPEPGSDRPPLVSPPKVDSTETPKAEQASPLRPSVVFPSNLDAGAGVLPNTALKLNDDRKPTESKRRTAVDTPIVAPTTMPRLDEPVARHPATRPEEVERVHVVKKYDTLAILAEQYYGSQRHADVILKANPQVDVRRLKLGTKLRIPPLAAATSRPAESTDKTKPAPAPVETKPGETFYTVKSGDSFYSIARTVYGDGERWHELHQMNKDVCPEPHQLKPGMKLRLAPSTKSESKSKAEGESKPKRESPRF